MINRSIAPEITRIKKPKFSPVLKIENAWNIPFYAIHDENQEVLKIEVVFRAGTKYAQNVIVPNFVNSMLPEGTSRLNANDIAENIDRYGAFLEQDIDKDYASVSLFTIQKFFPFTLPILMDVVFDATLPEEEFEILRNARMQRYQVNMEKVGFVAGKKFVELLFPGSAYAANFDLESYQATKLQDLRLFYQKHYLNATCSVFISGNIMDENIQAIKEQLSKKQLSEKYVIDSPEFAAKAYQAQQFFIEKPSALQSAIRIGRPLFGRNHPDFMGLKVLNVVLGGYFGSRLMKNIREDKGYTYGIGSGIATLEQSGYFYISTEVGAQFCAKALNEIYKEIDLLQQHLIPEDELELVKQYMLGNLLKSFDGCFEQLERFKSIVLQGNANDFFDNYFDTIEQITSQELMQLAQEYLSKSTLTELVVGLK